MVRCAQCGGEWRAEAQPDELQAESDLPTDGAEHSIETAAPLPTITAMDRLAISPPKPAPRNGLLAAWVVTGVVLFACIAAAITWRGAVVRAWPPSSRILGSADPAVIAPAHHTEPAHHAEKTSSGTGSE